MLINHPWIKKYVQSQMHVHQEKKLHSKQSRAGWKARFKGILPVIIISGESVIHWDYD